MCTDVRIQTESHTSHLAFLGCQFVDDFQLGNALDVETEDIVVQSEVDFPVALADTGINNLRTGETSSHTGLYLATADAVGTQSCFADDTQDAGIGIGLDGIMDAEALVLLSLTVNGTERFAQQLRVVVVERCLYPFQFIFRKNSFTHFCVVGLITNYLNSWSLRLCRARFLSSSRMRNEML